MRAPFLILLAILLVAAACGGDSDEAPAEAEAIPVVVAAVATRENEGTWNFSVTISSPYDSPERYADAWRVLDPDGNQLAERVLTHDHANEQPFTRSLSGVRIPAGVEKVRVEPRDSRDGYGTGRSIEVRLTQGR